MLKDNVSNLLVDGEEFILDDSAYISEVGEGKLVLTNKRLFFCVNERASNSKCVIKKEVGLQDIANVSGDFGMPYVTEVVGSSWLVVRLKAGEEWRCQFNAGAISHLDFDTAQKISISKVNDWVNAVRLMLREVSK